MLRKPSRTNQHLCAFPFRATRREKHRALKTGIKCPLNLDRPKAPRWSVLRRILVPSLATLLAVVLFAAYSVGVMFTNWPWTTTVSRQLSLDRIEV